MGSLSCLRFGSFPQLGFLSGPSLSPENPDFLRPTTVTFSEPSPVLSSTNVSSFPALPLAVGHLLPPLPSSILQMAGSGMLLRRARIHTGLTHLKASTLIAIPIRKCKYSALEHCRIISTLGDVLGADLDSIFKNRL